MRFWSLILVALAVSLVMYLALWPTEVKPVAWDAPVSPGLAGVFQTNGKLANFELLGADLPGCEAVAVDAQGLKYTGSVDGRVAVIDDQGKSRTLARTGGRPLGLKLLPDGALVVADAYKGLLRVDAAGKVQVLADRDRSGRRFTFADDVDLLPNGHILFTDASQRFALPVFELDALEHGTTGALYEFDPATKQVARVSGGFSFANGVAAHHEGHYAFVNETWSYRVMRVWLDGPKRGKKEVVIDNLPGFPDNITYDRQRDLFWVALGSPRDAGLDLLASSPALRKVVARLPKGLRPKAQRHGMVVALHPDGRVAHFFDDPSAEGYSPLTSALATKEWLYLGSFQHAGIARVKLSVLVP
jgi:sugar lactone lactonase YvrE